MPLKRILILLTTILLPISFVSSQDLKQKDLARAVQHADISYYYDQNYEKAAEEYQAILTSYPSNHNISAKLGICYLNIDGKLSEALKLLKFASSNIVDKEVNYIEFGDKAPLDTYLYLAQAYQSLDSLDKALSLYNSIRKKSELTELFRVDYIDNQIRDCRYAMEMKKKPLTIISGLFIPWLEEYPGACNPVLSRNDSVFIFTQKVNGKTKILCSYRNGKGWNKPKDITRQLGGYDRFYSNSITGNGKFLVLFMDDGGDGNLFYSQRKDSTWSKFKSFGKPINTIYWESHGCITPDGKTLYLTSNRPGGEGELDIWQSDKNPDNTWSKPVNLGNIINTPFNEETPFYDEKSNSLVFCSVGHIGMGGFDVFRSVKRNGAWTNPVGMPFAFNTTLDNTFFIVPNNSPGFITSVFDNRTGTRNIYSEVAVDPADEISVAEGSIILKDGINPDPGKAKITLTDLKNKGETRTAALSAEGKYRFEIKPGEYQVFVSYPDYKTDTINITLPLYYLSRYMAFQSDLIPLGVSSGNFVAIRNILFAFNSFELNNDAKAGLEQLRSILIANPSLKIEVAGYADSKGTPEYNRQLSEKRAQAAIDYLVTSYSIPASRFIRKGYGESRFVALNENPDGSDNPEGRSLNRRVTFGIVDSHTGTVIVNDSYTPERLRPSYSIKYNVVLARSSGKLPESAFANLKLDGLLFVRSVETDSVSFYTAGQFYNRSQALKFLDYARGNGFPDAYLADNYNLAQELKSVTGLLPIVTKTTGKKVYTIQLKASRVPLNKKIFGNLAEVREFPGEDGYYRYVVGEYKSYSAAKEALKQVTGSGFSDAFIREFGILVYN